MKYVPGLIPDHSKVNKEEDFNDSVAMKRPGWWTFLSYFGAVCFLMAALVHIFSRFWEGFFFLILGLMFLPGVHNALERRLRFTFTWPIKTAFCLILFAVISVLSNGYEKKEQLATAELKREQAQEVLQKEQERLKVEKKAKARQDSLNKYLSLARADMKSHHFSAAVGFFNKALLYTDTGKAHILSQRADSYFKAGKYEKAIADYSSLIDSGKQVSNHLYKRALCYEKSGKRQKAVNDLKKAIKLGSPEADKLHEKINPLKRRIAYYVTRCCDGSTSSAKGRGACSHHGGVCNWDDPVYEEYRKY
ncbi:MAG: tetratricopeptide repeat protein [Owenweeksia sp.]